MRVIKIFGLPRSCTNVTEYMLRDNFRVRVLTNYPCWKHGENTFVGRELHDRERNIDTDDMKFIVCTKNPYDWLFSLYTFENRTKRSKHRTMLDFLDGTAWHYKDQNPIDVFNKLTKHWLTMLTDPNIIQQVKYEDILKDQATLFEKIAKIFQLPPKRKKFAVLQSRIDPCIKNTKKEFKKRVNKFSPDLIRYINKRLDPKVVEMAGYKLQVVK
jgi:hypothetical protein